MLATGAEASKMSHDMRTQADVTKQPRKFNKKDKGAGVIEFAWHDVQGPRVTL